MMAGLSSLKLLVFFGIQVLLSLNSTNLSPNCKPHVTIPSRESFPRFPFPSTSSITSINLFHHLIHLLHQFNPPDETWNYVSELFTSSLYFQPSCSSFTWPSPFFSSFFTCPPATWSPPTSPPPRWRRAPRGRSPPPPPGSQTRSSATLPFSLAPCRYER